MDRVRIPAASANVDDLRRRRHPRPQGEDRQVLQGPVGRPPQAQHGQQPHRGGEKVKRTPKTEIDMLFLKFL